MTISRARVWHTKNLSLRLMEFSDCFRRDFRCWSLIWDPPALDMILFHSSCTRGSAEHWGSLKFMNYKCEILFRSLFQFFILLLPPPLPSLEHFHSVISWVITKKCYVNLPFSSHPRMSDEWNEKAESLSFSIVIAKVFSDTETRRASRGGTYWCWRSFQPNNFSYEQILCQDEKFIRLWH